MTTTYTQTELATRVLRDLGIVAGDEQPSAADMADAEQIIGSEVAMLTAKGIPIVGGSDIQVPIEYLSVLSRRLGLAVAPSYGLVDLASAQLAMPAAEADLRRIGANAPTGSIADCDYF